MSIMEPAVERATERRWGHSMPEVLSAVGDRADEA